MMIGVIGGSTVCVEGNVAVAGSVILVEYPLTEIGMTGPAGALDSSTRIDEGMPCATELISGIGAVRTMVVVATLCGRAVVIYSVCAASTTRTVVVTTRGTGISMVLTSPLTVT